MNKIQVAYDREIFLLQEVGGVSKSFAKHILNFVEMQNLGIEPLLTFSRTNNKHLLSLESTLTENMPPSGFFIQPNNSIQTLLTFGPVRAVLSRFSGGYNPVKSSDIFHATYYRPQKYDRRSIKKLVVTVHDFIPEALGWTGIRNPHIGKRKLIKEADLVLCVSECSKQLMIENLGFVPNEVRVVPHGADFVERAHLNVGVFSILYVGHRRGYKNYELLVNALSGLEKYREYKLVLAGPKLESEEINFLESKIRNRWTSVVNPSDVELQKLYSRSSMHCVTSVMEGFGMTLIEAIGAGCPVVATQIPIFQETLHGDGILVDPYDPSELRDTIMKLMLDSDFYDQIQKGVLHARPKYSWSSKTVELSKIYRELAR